MTDKPLQPTDDADLPAGVDGAAIARLADLDDRLGGQGDTADDRDQAAGLETTADDRLPADYDAAIDTILLLRQVAAADRGVEHDPIVLPRQIGRYEILREAGRGAFAFVLEARDELLQRRVAIKVARPEALVSAAFRRRFIREAELAARLMHPHIVAIHEVGEREGLVFIANEYCAGGDLAGWLERHHGPLPVRQAAEIVHALAEAVAHAHASGVVHRDIKPANVLLATPAGSSAVATGSAGPDSIGHMIPKLGDFGLGKLFHDLEDRGLTQLTRTGTRLGTPAWMAPEQIDGSFGEVGPATDVHALGLLLDRLLTGRSLFAGKTEAETFRAVLLEEPVAADRMGRRVPADLAAVCLKCLAKRPSDRYASAAELADDLARFLSDAPTRARPRSWLARLMRTIRKRPIPWLLATAAAAAVVVAVWSSRARDHEARRLAESHAEIRQREAVAELRRGFDSWRSGDAAAAVVHLRACGTIDAALADSLAGRWLLGRLHGEQAILLHPDRTSGKPVDIYVVARAHDGSSLAAGHADGRVSILRLDAGGAPAGRPSAFVAHDEVNDIAFSPDGGQVATVGEDGRLCLWAAADGTRQREPHRATGPLFAVAYAPSGGLLACGGAAQAIALVSVADGRPVRTLHPFAAAVAAGKLNADADIESLQFVGEDRLVAACGSMVSIVDLATGGLESFPGHDGSVGQIALSRDGKKLVSGGTDREPRVWALDPPQLVRTLPRHPGWVQGCDFSPGGEFVATGCRDGVIRIFDLATGGEQRKLVGHIGRTWDVRYDAAGMILSAGADGTLRRWDTRPAAEARGLRTVRIPGAPEPTDKIRGRRVAVGIVAAPPRADTAVLSLQGRDVIVDLASGAVTTSDSQATAAAFSMAVDARRGRFAAVPTSGAIELHAIPSPEPQRTGGHERPADFVRLPRIDGAVTTSLAWTSSGGLVAGCNDGRLLDWNASLEIAREVDRLERTIDAVHLAPAADKRLAVAAGPRVLVYPLPLSAGGGRTVVTLPPDEGIVVALAWSPDGRRIACGTTKGQVSIIDAESGRLLKLLPRHARDVAGIAWPPDDRTLVTADAECVRFSDIATTTTLDEVRPGWNIESLDFMSGAGPPVLVIAGSEAAASGMGREPRLGIFDLDRTLEGESP